VRRIAAVALRIAQSATATHRRSDPIKALQPVGLLRCMSPFLARSGPEPMGRFVRSWPKLTCERSGGIRVLTHQRHWLCTAAMVLMPGLGLSNYSSEPIQCWPLSLGADIRRGHRNDIAILLPTSVKVRLALRFEIRPFCDGHHRIETRFMSYHVCVMET
jgi:hypothetical protein